MRVKSEIQAPGGVLPGHPDRRLPVRGGAADPALRCGQGPSFELCNPALGTGRDILFGSGGTAGGNDRCVPASQMEPAVPGVP